MKSLSSSVDFGDLIVACGRDLHYPGWTMEKYKAVLQYVGTQYAGWQIQKDQKTIQGQLREALHRVCRERVSVVGAGRTDSGVHALKQVAHFRLTDPVHTQQATRALNGVLPWDIRVLRISSVSEEFHAQRNALKKRYQYRIYNGTVLSPFLRGLVYHVTPRLDIQAMREGAALLLHSHDFSGFSAASTTVKNKVRTIYLSRLLKRGHHLTYQVEANGFLHHMVRNIVGTLLEIGRGKRPPLDVVQILRSKNRRLAGPTAQAHGLYLANIWY